MVRLFLSHPPSPHSHTMLDAIRRHSQTWIAKVVLALIAIPFALWGVDFYFQGSGSEPPVASVDGEEISPREFSRALKSRRDMLESRGLSQVDTDSREFREGVLKQLVDARMVSGVAERLGFVASQREIETTIRSAPAFQDDGAFSQARFDAWLREQGLGERELSRLLREDALGRQVHFGIGEGAVAGTVAAGRVAALLDQKREVSELAFDADAFAAGVQVDDAAVAAEYNARKAEFVIPAQVRLQYVVLSADVLQGRVQISDEAMKQYYEANRARFQDPEQRQASHILIKTDAGMKDAERAAAKAKAEKLFSDLKAAPAKFGELARQHSQDPGSAAGGGDLGSFTREMMVKPFADAVFSMRVGELRGPVESDFGYHLIRLDGIRPAVQTPMETVREEIRTELSRLEAQRLFAEAAERFSNMVYEQPDSLAPVVKEFALELRESGWVDRNRADPGFLANPRLLDAAFAPDALEKRHNTEAIEVAGGVLVAARVLEHKAAGTKPLAEVAVQIREGLIRKAAREKAIVAGRKALDELRAGRPPAAMGAPVVVSRVQPANLPTQAIQAVFKVDASKLPGSAGVETDSGFRVYRVTQVIVGNPDDTRRKLVQRDLGRVFAEAEMDAYLNYLRSRAEITLSQASLDKKGE